MNKEITVERYKDSGESTLSNIYFEEELICVGLEDTFRPDKIWGETRIPEGKYKIKVRTHGGFHKRYGRYAWHQGMLQITEVAGFSDVLIHIGNTAKDTKGCLLVGLSVSVNTTDYIVSSAVAYKKLYLKVLPYALEGKLSIFFLDMEI